MLGLTRDSDAVLSMVNRYGGWLIEGDTVMPLKPLTWGDVIRDYSIDDSLPKEEKAGDAVVKAQLFVSGAERDLQLLAPR